MVRDKLQVADGMKLVEYNITFDDAFIVEMVRRYRQVHKWRSLRLALKWLAGAFLAFAVVSSLVQQWWGVAAMWAVALGVLVASPRIDYWLAKRRWRKSPSRGEKVHMSLGPGGVHSIGRTHDSQLAWTAFSQAVSLPDGMLLYQGPHLFQWLPDSALIAGTREEVEAILRDAFVSERGKGEQSLAAESR